MFFSYLDNENADHDAIDETTNQSDEEDDDDEEDEENGMICIMIYRP